MRLAEAIEVVEWKDYGADFEIEDDGRTLRMTIWARDTDRQDDTSEDAEDLQSLNARTPVRPGVDGRTQIRDLIHWFLCHEADEKLFFAGEATFYPDHPVREDR